VWQGITDDHRNTDNAWVESEAFSVHDPVGTGVGKFTLMGGDDAAKAKWATVHEHIALFINHRDLVKKVVIKQGAYW